MEQLIQTKKQNIFYKRMGFVFVVVGLIGLSIPLFFMGFLSDYAFLDSLAKTELAASAGASASSQFLTPKSAAIITTGPSPTPTLTSSPDYGLSNIPNRLIIPKAKIDMPIIAGDNANILLKGGWLFPGTSTPANGGNSVIFGHRFRYLPPISNTFYSLDKVGVGDEFRITWGGKEYDYKVVESKIIDPTDLSVIAPSSAPRVTLITCAPLFSTTHRLVVIGELIATK